jgi:hypothetical protein
MILEKTALDIYNCIQDMHQGKQALIQLEVLNSPKDHTDMEKVFDMVDLVNQWSHTEINLHPLMAQLNIAIDLHMKELESQLHALNKLAYNEIRYDVDPCAI